MRDQTNKKHMIQSGVITGLSALALVVAACGGVGGPIGKTGSPTQDYRDLGPAIPKAEVRPTPVPTAPPPVATPPSTEVNQVVFPQPQIFEVDKDNKEVPASLDFVEGQRRTYLIKTQVFARNVTYQLKMEGLPQTGANQVVFKALNDPKRPGYYELSWTPAIGTLSRDESNGHGRKYPIQFKYVITNKNLTSLPLSVRNVDGASFGGFHARLMRDDRSPRIMNIALQSDVMFVGDRNLVTVSVVDPSAAGTYVPELIVLDEVGGSSEKPVQKLGRLVELKERKNKGDGRFEFDLLLDTRPILQDEATLKPESEGRFVIRVIGATSRREVQETKSLKLVKKEEPKPAASPSPAPNAPSAAAPAATAPAPQTAAPKPAAAPKATKAKKPASTSKPAATPAPRRRT